MFNLELPTPLLGVKWSKHAARTLVVYTFHILRVIKFTEEFKIKTEKNITFDVHSNFIIKVQWLPGITDYISVTTLKFLMIFRVSNPSKKPVIKLNTIECLISDSHLSLGENNQLLCLLSTTLGKVLPFTLDMSLRSTWDGDDLILCESLSFVGLRNPNIFKDAKCGISLHYSH